MLICYLPAQYFYERFLKGENTSGNFFRAFFSWSIFSFLLMMLLQLVNMWIRVEVLDDFLQQYNSNFHFGNLLFYQLLFWQYSFDKTTKTFHIVKELNFKNKLLNFVLVFSLLIFLGFFIRFEESHYWINWLKHSLLFFTSLFLFIRLRNLKIITSLINQ